MKKKRIIKVGAIVIALVMVSAIFVVLAASVVNLKATPNPSENNIRLEWELSDPQNYSYKVFQKKPGSNTFQTISAVDFNSSTEIVNVLNVYPGQGNNVSFTTYDGETMTLPQSGALKMWMEKPNALNSKGYGKGLIEVTPMTIDAFNSNPAGALKDSNGNFKYDVIMFGSWDSNGSKDLTASSANEVKNFLNSGRGVLFGHDTINFANFGTLKPYVNIGDSSGTTFNGSPQVAGGKNVPTQGWNSNVKIMKKGMMTNYPWKIGDIGTILTVPSCHSHLMANGDTWLKFSHADYTQADIDNAGNYYLTTWNNAAQIQTGHSSGYASEDEQKVLANTLFYLKQLTDATFLVDNSGQDLDAPKKVSVVSSSNTGKNLTINLSREDVGTEYQYYVQALSKSNSGNINSDIVKATITTGVKGYSYVIDNNPTTQVDDTIDTTSSNINYTLGDKTYTYLHIKAIDNAGNIGETTHILIHTNVKPELSLSQNPESWTNKNVIITATGTDSDGDVIEITKPDGTVVSADATTYEVDRNGEYTFIAKDNCGATTTTTIEITNIDKFLPWGNTTIVQPTEEVRGAVIKFTASDDLSGVARIIKPDGTETSTSKIDYEVREPGTYTFKIVDYAGNENTVDVDVTIVSDGVVVKYVDQNTGESIETQELQGNVGENYTTEAKQFNGYKLVSLPTNGNGRFEIDEQVVVYGYKKISAGVDVKYIDEITGEEIVTPTMHIDGLEKDPYSTTSKEIEGYELVTTPENANGQMTVELTTVIYGYKKNSNVISRYIDENSKEEIIPEIVVKYKEGYPYSTTERTFNGYRLVSKTDNTYGTVGREDIIVTYYYKKISAGVDVKYVDEMTGEEISGMIHMSGLEKDPYTTSSKEIPGYELVTIPENATGEMKVENTTVTYGYKLISYVTVRCVDENTNRILYISEPVKYLEGQTYSTFKRDITGYTYTRVDKAEEAQIGREDITVTYYYKKNTSVTVKYVDMLDNNKEIHEELLMPGLQGDNYTTEPVDIEGFECVGSQGVTQGVMGSEPSTVIYKYKKLANLVTEHIDANTGLKITEDVTTTYKEGDAYEALAQNIAGYVVVQEPEEKTGIMGREEIRKQYYYKKLSKGLVVKYVDVKTNQVLDRIVYDGNENDKVTLETKSFMHYVLDSKPDMDEVILTPEANELIYYYRRTVEMDVVGIDVDTGEELYKTQISGREEDNYSTIAKTLDDYEVVNKSIAEGIFDRANTKIEFLYKKIGERKDSTIILKYVDKDTNKVLKSETITAKVGDKYTTEKLDFENYKFVEVVGLESGIVTEEPQEVTYYYTKKTGKVIIVYEDEEGNIIKEDQIVGKVQEDYNVEIQEIEGYKIIEVPQNVNGKFTEETIKLKVKLQKIEEPVKTGNVIVIYQDEDGNELRREESTGKVGDSFEFVIKDINGYEFVQKPEDIRGNYVDGTIVIKIDLKKIPEPVKTGKVVVIYEDENGKEVKREELIGNVGEDYKVDVKEINGYKVVQIPSTIEGKYTEDSIEVKIKVEKIPNPIKTGKVIVVYEDENGNVIKREESIGNVGDEYKIEVTEQEGYKIIHVSDNTEGKYINGTIEVKVKIQKISKPPVNKGIIIIKYLDDEGNVIKEEMVKTGVPGEKITIDIPEIEGYRIIGDKTIEATFVDGKLVIDAKYEKISNIEEEIKPQPDDNKEDNNNIPDTGDINVILILAVFAISTLTIYKKVLVK